LIYKLCFSLKQYICFQVGLSCIYIAWLRELFDPIFVPELELKDSTKTAISASFPELYPEKLTVRVV
jgi:hypothetical protein